MNILSLFGGIECGRVALNKLGITPTNYFSSEINPHAMNIARTNFPDIKHLESVTDVNAADLPQIDLILAGFPCTDLSRAGRQNGFYEVDSLDHYLYLKDNNHKFQGQSYLFWEFVRLLNELKPRYFLLENVIMPAKWKKLITNTLRLESFKFNSSDFSAQSRERLYWTNIKIEAPDRISKLTVKDILDNSVNYGWLDGVFVPVGDLSNDYSARTKSIGGLLKESDASSKYLTNDRHPRLTDFKSDKRVYSINGKAPTMTTSNGAIFRINDRFRRLIILEQERLQGLPDNYTRVRGISDGLRSACIGNGWTVEVIEHLLKNVA